MELKAKKTVSFDDMYSIDLEINSRESVIPQTSYKCGELSNNEDQRRRQVKQLFDSLDRNRNGYIEINELKQLLKYNERNDMPKGLARRLLKLSDTNRDGRLNFEEFYEMNVTYNYILNKFINSYCSKLIPPRKTPSTGDEVDGRYEENYSCSPPPITMLIFSLLEIFTFIFDVLYKGDHNKDTSFSNFGLETNGPLASAMIYNPHLRHQVWRFITYMFVHAGASHLTANLVIQLFLGTALELVHCWWRIVCIYLAGILAAAVGTSLWDPKTYFCGASGGVYALVTAHIATVILNWKEMDFPGIQLFVFTFYCTADLGQSIYNHVTKEIDHVGYIGHLCGAVAGLLVGIGVLRNLNVKNWEVKLWWICIIIYAICMISGIYVHVSNPDYFTPPNYTM